jgi:hypothetical protein
MRLRKEDGRIRLFTRTGVDWSLRYPSPVEAAAALRVRSCTIDGELVVTDDNGISDFEMLQSRAHDFNAFLYGFDLLELDGEDLRPLPLDTANFGGASRCRIAQNGLHAGHPIDIPVGQQKCARVGSGRAETKKPGAMAGLRRSD